MFVCVCFEATEERIREIIKENPDITMKEILKCGVGTQCHLCLKHIKEILNESKSNQQRKSH